MEKVEGGVQKYYLKRQKISKKKIKYKVLKVQKFPENSNKNFPNKSHQKMPKRNFY